MAWRRLISLTLLAALSLSGCDGDDDDSDAEPSEPEPTEAPADAELIDSFRGVTAESIKIGFVMVDWACIQDFIDFRSEHDQVAYQAFVDEINENGGILGRTIEPVYQSYCPIGSAAPLEVCTAMTEDEEVFAVIGLFIDFTGDAQLCLSREHETIHIGQELAQAWIDEAPPGLLLSRDVTPERRVGVLLNLLEAEGTLDGRTVAVLTDEDNQARAEEVVAGLEDLGVEVGTTGVVTVTGSAEAGVDTSTGQAQLDAVLKRWNGEDVDTVFILGLSMVARQWVEKLVSEMPDALLITDSPASAVEAGRDLAEAGVDPNPYEGILSAEGETEGERWPTDRVQECKRTFEERTGITAIAPDDVEPGPDGKRETTYLSVMEGCGDIEVFRMIAEKAGPDLTNETWTEAVNTFGSIPLVNTDFATFGEAKYDATDGFRLVSYDNSINNWAAEGEIINTAEG